MKHVSIFFVILSVFINYSCTDESQNNLLDLEVNASAITRSLAPPNFEQDWENQTSIQLTIIRLLICLGLNMLLQV